MQRRTLMPQYPIPPWPEGTHPLAAGRCRVSPGKLRYRHLPVVHGDADGVTVHVHRGDESTIDQARHSFNSESLFFDENIGKPFLVVTNRNGFAWLAKINRTVAVGTLEWWMYTAPSAPPLEVSQATLLEDRRAALEAELAYLDRVQADGWELVFDRGLFGKEPYAYLVDSRRPDIDLTPGDLP